jgi:hypothetical protein
MAMNQGQADIRGTMGQELMDIEKDVLNEESRLRDLNVQMDLGEVEGAQLAARDAQEARAAAMTQGFQGLQSIGQQAMEMVPLYQKTEGVRQTQKLGDAASKAGITQDDFRKNVQGLAMDPKFGYLSGLGAEGVDFNAFMGELSRKQVRGVGNALGYKGY